ncbi:hypothetical protein Q4543_19010 [Salipiger sp. 1_MG-2023]|uniref:hypothetical protein n=1 Tax=Salipiger sp. 1_MG-2023 TaxID=3062665 RepID=UPI0026E25B48|nr:hypothetical protein [Salipiger sp. 1_MG-2023]MDO6587607.1 hypothetical protein [Salipiger sp. 1_MG-2023]
MKICCAAAVTASARLASAVWSRACARGQVRLHRRASEPRFGRHGVATSRVFDPLVFMNREPHVPSLVKTGCLINVQPGLQRLQIFSQQSPRQEEWLI